MWKISTLGIWLKKQKMPTKEKRDCNRMRRDLGKELHCFGYLDVNIMSCLDLEFVKVELGYTDELPLLLLVYLVSDT